MNYFALIFAVIYTVAGASMLTWRRKEWPAIGILAMTAVFFTAMAFRWV